MECKAMKYKTTRKAVVAGSYNLVFAGYCDLQNLLRCHDAIAYTSGVYGWNFDVYKVHGLTICTGYRGMLGKRLEGIAEAEEKAMNILAWENKDMTYDEKREAVEELLHEFCKANGGY